MAPQYSVRNARGQYTSRASFNTAYRLEDGANRGGQTWIGGRYHVEGVELNMKSLQQVLQEPSLLRHVTKRTESMLATAQSLAITDMAYYGMIVYNNRPELGPVGVVFCDNYPSVIDDAYHQTLYKVLAQYGTK